MGEMRWKAIRVKLPISGSTAASSTARETGCMLSRFAHCGGGGIACICTQFFTGEHGPTGVSVGETRSVPARPVRGRSLIRALAGGAGRASGSGLEHCCEGGPSRNVER